MNDQAIPEGYKLRVGQVYTWEEVMDWANEHTELGWDHRGEPLRHAGLSGRDFRVLPGGRDGIACFVCAGIDLASRETLWTCTHVAPEYALPPLHYYSIMFYCDADNKDALFLTRAASHSAAREKSADELKHWPGYIVWNITRLDPRPIEAGEVVHLGGG